jgi:hypothetical protein
MQDELKRIEHVGWVIAILIVIFFAVSEVGISDRQVFETSFLPPSRVFSDLGPVVRLGERNKIKKINSLVAEPIYFNVRLPVLSRSADVKVFFKKPSEVKSLSLGVIRGEETFDLHKLQIVSEGDGFIAARVNIDLRGVPKRDGSYRFFIAAPGVSSEGPLVLRQARITARRPSLLNLTYGLLQ